MKTCPICGKDDLKHQGALNMHMYHCKMKNNVSRETIEEDEKECSHSWRLLSVSHPIENRAYKNGYMEVCRKCQELR